MGCYETRPPDGPREDLHHLVEVVGELKKASSATVAYERRTGARTREHRFSAAAVVSVIDRRNNRILIDNRKYSASTTFLVNDDIVTGRLGEDLARQIVDDVLTVLSKNDKQPSIAKEIGHE